MFIFKVVIIGGAFFGVAIMTWRSNAAAEEARIYKSVQIFGKMDDILHKRCPRTHALWLSWHVAWFEEADNAFHNAKNLQEKFKATKQLNEVIHKQDEFLHNVWGIDPAEDEIFHQLDMAFKKM